MNATATSLDTTLFDNAPCGIAIVDTQGVLRWMNQTLSDIVGVASDEFLGKTIESFSENISEIFSLEQDLYKFTSAEGDHWFQREIKQQQGESLYVFQDVTKQQQLASENERLRLQVQDLKLTDDLTGLPNKRAISQTLDLQISRSRRYQNPLSLVMVHVALDDEQVKTLGDGADPMLLGVSHFLRDRLRWVDQIGRWEENIFVLVLPETELADAENLIQKIKNEQSTMVLPNPFSHLKPILSFGIKKWAKGDDKRTLLEQVVADLQ